MRVFNGKQAAEDYMASHTLAFSTPELTLMRFSFWLGDMVPDPNDKNKSIPRLMTFVEEKDFEPAQIIDDEKYVPSGAVLNSGMYGSATAEVSSESKFCSQCGSKIDGAAKFCNSCGATQV